MLFSDLFNLWFASLLSLAPRTLDSYTSIANLYILPSLGAVDLIAITQQMCTSLLSTIAEVGHTRTAQLTYIILENIFKYAVRNALLSTSPMQYLQPPKHHKKDPQWLSPSEIHSYLQAIASDRYRLAWELALFCGLRRGEIVGLRWEDVDFDTMLLHISNQRITTAAGTTIDSLPKSASGIRDIPIPIPVLNTLQVTPHTSKYVIANHGQPITPGGLDHAHSRLLANNGIRHVRLHDIRHTMGAVAIRSGVSIKTLQVLLGHAHYSTTADIYAHVDMETRRSAIVSITQNLS